MQIHAFSAGRAACTAILDVATPILPERFLNRFPGGSEADYRAAFAQLGLSFAAAESSINVLVVRLGDEVVLVDTGEGGALIDGLGAAGIAPGEVTTVVLTHSHGDHVIGLFNEDGGPAFPNARYVLSRAERDFWARRSPDDPRLALLRSRDLRLIDTDETIFPGLDAVPLPGHTPGQIGLLVDGALLHLADLLHSPMQFVYPGRSAKFDADTSVSVPTRTRMLAHAADAGLLTFFYHLSFPGVGYVRRAGDAFAWEPAG